MKKKIILVPLCLFLVTGFTGSEVIRRIGAEKDHFYAMADGYEYGYDRLLTAVEKDLGQVTSPLVMLRYAGMRDGKYQIFSEENTVYTVFECATQCDFIKVMMFINGKCFKTERVRPVPNSIGYLALQDAKHGKLKPNIIGLPGDKQQKQIWFDENKGMQTFALDL